MARIPGTFGARVGWRRRHLGMTQYQLAQKMGVREADIQRWESDVNFPREPWKINSLADQLETTTDFLFARTSDARADVPAPPLLDDPESLPSSSDVRRSQARGRRQANGSSRRRDR
jgi:transcriptional regulator with XRE-family HTH domain